tara:strand:- start:57 stop:278 length:222 start_codon:yes stop_codon:yes gene_type:complete
MTDMSLIDILKMQGDVKSMDDISAAVVYVGKVLESIRDNGRVANEINERRADLDLRMTNIHIQALELARERTK